MQELSPTTDANQARSLMNIHESLLDEFKDEQKLKQLDLSQEQLEAWIMVHTPQLVYGIETEWNRNEIACEHTCTYVVNLCIE